MSDDLRTRIAAVLEPRLLSIMRFPESSIAHRNAVVMADAVIRELKLDTVIKLARDWYEDYDITPANDPRNPSDVDIAYDDAGYQILVALGLEKPVFP